MKSPDTAREIVTALRGDPISPKLAREIGRCLAIVHGSYRQFDFARYGTKLGMRHAVKPGRKRAPGGYTPEKKIVFAASAWARWLEPSIGKEAALAKVAAFHKIDDRKIRRIAFEQKEKIPEEFFRDDWSDFP